MKTVHTLASLFQTVLVVLLVVVAFFSFAYKLPMFSKHGFTFYSVVSGSMEPTIHTGSLIYSGRYKLDDLKKGDIITFSKPDSALGRNTIVTHRIAEAKITQKQSTGPNKRLVITKQYEFTTKGDANGSIDAEVVLPNQILGKYQWNIPTVGYVANFAQTPTGFVSLVVLPALVLIVWEVISLVLHFKQQFESKSKREIEAMKEQLANATQTAKKTKTKKKDA